MAEATTQSAAPLRYNPVNPVDGAIQSTETLMGREFTDGDIAVLRINFDKINRLNPAIIKKYTDQVNETFLQRGAKPFGTPDEADKSIKAIFAVIQQPIDKAVKEAQNPTRAEDFRTAPMHFVAANNAADAIPMLIHDLKGIGSRIPAVAAAPAVTTAPPAAPAAAAATTTTTTVPAAPPTAPEEKKTKEVAMDEGNVFFKFDKYDLSPEYKKHLETVAAAMAVELKKDPNATFVVHGYASADGPLAHNKVLSQHRAEAVASFIRETLVDKQGFKPEQLAKTIAAQGEGVEGTLKEGELPKHRHAQIFQIKADDPAPAAAPVAVVTTPAPPVAPAETAASVPPTTTTQPPPAVAAVQPAATAGNDGLRFVDRPLRNPYVEAAGYVAVPVAAAAYAGGTWGPTPMRQIGPHWNGVGGLAHSLPVVGGLFENPGGGDHCRQGGNNYRGHFPTGVVETPHEHIQPVWPRGHDAPAVYHAAVGPAAAQQHAITVNTGRTAPAVHMHR